MIKDANLGKELVVTTANKAGVLANASKIIADHGINIEGVAGYVTENDEAKLMFTVSDTVRAKEALQKAGYKSVTEHEIIIVDLANKPGALKAITSKIASDNIDIKYMYGTTCPCGECAARIILSTGSNEKAIVLLKVK